MPVVVRALGTKEKEAREILRMSNVHLTDDAVQEAQTVIGLKSCLAILRSSPTGMGLSKVCPQKHSSTR